MSRHVFVGIAVCLLTLLLVVPVAPHAAAENGANYRLMPVSNPFPALSDAVVARRAQPSCRAGQTSTQPSAADTWVNISVSVFDANGNALTGPSFVLPTLPYTLTYKTTISNTGGAATQAPGVVELLAGDDDAYSDSFYGLPPAKLSITTPVLPILPVSQSVTYTRTVTVQSGMNALFIATPDPYCQVPGLHYTSNAINRLQLLTNNVDWSVLSSAVYALGGPTGTYKTSLYSGTQYMVYVTLANFGTKETQQDMTVSLTGSIIKGKATITIPHASLPKPGAVNSYFLADAQGHDEVFTAKTVTRPQAVSLTATANPTHAITEDTYSNNSYHFPGKINPVKPDLVLYFYEDICGAFANQTTQFTVQPRNNGPASVTKDFTIRMSVDGKVTGAPVVVSGIGAKSDGPVQLFSTIFTKPGKHIVSFVVDSGKVVSEYDEKNNTLTQTINVVASAA